MQKIKADKENLLFIGYDGYEEYYQDTTEKGGWSFMGLRPATEETLREVARDTDINEFVTIPPFLEKYIDYEAFADDMEEDWYERYDVQATRENEEGEILYLGFGSGTSVDHYFKENGIIDYDSYINHFDIVGLSEEEFILFFEEYCR